MHQPQFVAVIGDVALAESEMKPEGASSAPQGGKKEAKKEKAPKKEKAKKEKAAAPPPAAAPKKVEHPLKILDKKSPSPLNGDEWKRTYKNNPPEVWKKKLWEMFDPKGWALWVCRFKYNHENEKQFMCANAIGGFVQRSDAMRKWAFGTMFVTGSEACLPIEISGCWLMRGDTVENLTEANDDALCYTWTKIDHTSAAGRALVEEYWTADVDGFLEGKLVTDGKLFL